MFVKIKFRLNDKVETYILFVDNATEIKPAHCMFGTSYQDQKSQLWACSFVLFQILPAHD
jgi:hypothetical protein